MIPFENITNNKGIPDYNHIGVDFKSWCIGVSTYQGFWYFEFGPLYFQWSKYG